MKTTLHCLTNSDQMSASTCIEIESGQHRSLLLFINLSIDYKTVDSFIQ